MSKTNIIPWTKDSEGWCIEADIWENQDLVAAAPELLDACRKALYAIKGREHTGFLEKAIAKATGQSD